MVRGDHESDRLEAMGIRKNGNGGVRSTILRVKLKMNEAAI